MNFEFYEHNKSNFIFYKCKMITYLNGRIGFAKNWFNMESVILYEKKLTIVDEL